MSPYARPRRDAVRVGRRLEIASGRPLTTVRLDHPTVVPGRAADTPGPDLLDRLTSREIQVLALMAEGRSNGAICSELAVRPKTVETHVGRVFTKLGLVEVSGENRRVLAVLAYLGRG